jgi:DNA-binding transcriptional LysR family regulator
MDAHLLPDVLVFLTVARLGSITKAAKRLNMVQSNVTARIQKLEQAAGATLLRRHARGVKLTGGGEAMLPMALRLEALLSDVACAFRGASCVREAKLRLGAIETVAAVQLPALVSEFLTKSPSVDITVQIGSSSSLIKQVQEDELDAAFVSRVPALASRPPAKKGLLSHSCGQRRC